MKLFEKIKKLEEEAQALGFCWQCPEQILQQIQSEIQEIQVHFNPVDPLHRSGLQEEIGDLMHAVISLALFCGFDPGQTLDKATTKFEQRFHHVKRIAHESGFTNLKNCSDEELLHIWQQAKQAIETSST
ncbi:MazG nucleotide pyrophosphohydrolase domain-containing protein [Legionella impletisoli]|uniref:Nucleoside triphosphate pyrophosphohydrolase n=1 Tax=Legionella impletisoli TaxID=343510 RepID=A0A917NEM5_9GAMM|nr:MazG nucleotide pyrophosphohydrolase domain-containing protein [Legionella impletisoli]GGI90413.1 nucleoside triphosphate pyrophosphohydrolase [Legionella impletisoli]